MTKDCKSCDAPVDPNASHAGAGDCRAAQRKEIRRLRTENEGLRGTVKEMEQHRASRQILAPDGSAAPPAPHYTFGDNIFKIS